MQQWLRGRRSGFIGEKQGRSANRSMMGGGWRRVSGISDGGSVRL
jgi:hypothetical protein